MGVLFDQGAPVPIRKALASHIVKAAREQGWSTLSNGDLLRAAEQAAFDLLLTTDTSLPPSADPRRPQNSSRDSEQEPMESATSSD
jgi:hypothetical protein